MPFFRLVSMITLFSISSVFAAQMQEAKVDYSATSTMDTGEMKMKTRIFSSPGKFRQEMGGEESMVSIVRHDKKVMWQLMSAMNMYMEMPLDQNDNDEDIRSYDIEQSVVGEETINGFKATKSKVIATSKKGKKFGGFFWTTPEGITIKMDLLYKDGDKKQRMTQELTDLKIGKLNPSLFEVPAGFSKSNMGNMMKGQSAAPASKRPSKMPDMKEMMKKAKESGMNIDPAELQKMMGR